MKIYNQLKSDLEWIDRKISELSRASRYGTTGSDLILPKLKEIREQVSKELEELDDWLLRDDWDREDL